MKRILFSLFVLLTAAQAQTTFPAGDLNARSHSLTGDAAAWPVLLSVATRDEAANTFSLSVDAMAQVKKFAVLHGKVRDGRTFFAKLLKAGARVFATDELQRATELNTEYDTRLREGNIAELTRIGGLYLQSLELIRKEIEQKRNEDIDALIAERNGDVTKRKGFLGDWKAAQKGDMLAQADGLRTGDASFAQLAFTDGVEVMVDPNSTVVVRESKMDKLDQTVRRDIALVKGSLLTKLTESAKERNNFTFQAGTAESQVRSGKFWASAVEERRVKLSNYDGTMEVSANKGKVQLKMNEGTIVEKGKDPLPPMPLLPAPQLVWNGIDSVIYADNFLLRWSGIPGASGYKVELCRSKEFNTNVKAFPVAQTSFTLENIELGLLHVRLTAVDKYGLRGLESPIYKLLRAEDKLPPAIYVDGWETDRRYTASPRLTVTGTTEADASFTVNGKASELDKNGVFSFTVAMDQGERQMTLRSTDRSGNSRQRLLSVVPIEVSKVTKVDWNCPSDGTTLIPNAAEISARGTAYPSMRVTVRHAGQESSVFTDAQGTWAISIRPSKGSQLTLVFESISDNIVVATSTYRIE